MSLGRRGLHLVADEALAHPGFDAAALHQADARHEPRLGGGGGLTVLPGYLDCVGEGAADGDGAEPDTGTAGAAGRAI